MASVEFENEVELHDMCRGKDWFADIGKDEFGRIVVYVNYMNGEILRYVPDYTKDGRQILTHFTASHTARAQDFMVDASPSFLHSQAKKPTTLKQVMEEIRQEAVAEGPEAVAELEAFTQHFRREVDIIRAEQETEQNVQYLTDELDKLERICGANILGDIFFEIHDKENAVTNLSAKYPDVRRRLEKLYDQFGFDIMYEEMEL